MADAEKKTHTVWQAPGGICYVRSISFEPPEDWEKKYEGSKDDCDTFVADCANGCRNCNKEPEVTQAAGTQAAGTQVAGTQAAETQAAETQAAETQAAETQAAETQAAETQAAETQAAGTQAAGTLAEGTHAEGTKPKKPK